MNTWELHFSKLLNKENTDMALYPIEVNNSDINTTTTDVVKSAIHNTKLKKAPGPDGIFNENLKDTTDYLLQMWTAIFNHCYSKAIIPECWRKSRIKMLYKGKGNPEDPDSYRGIALENHIYKVFSTIIAHRLIAQTDSFIPDEQFGFRKGRGTIHVMKNLMDDIGEATRLTKGKYYTIFVDFTKAFDLLNRSKLMEKLEIMIGRNNPLTAIVNNLLVYNVVEITNGVTISEPIIQCNGVLQGDPLSPILFNIAIADITSIIEDTSVKMYQYADDIALGSCSKEELQLSMDRLQEYANNNSLIINHSKTVQMIFRKGGKIARGDRIKYDAGELNIVNSVKYLGMTLQPSGTSFRNHIRERSAAAIKSIYDIENLTRLALQTAMALFYAKVLPVLSYGIELIWDHLTLTDLKCLETIKARFLKRTLGISKRSPSRLAYELAQETFLMEDLRHRLQLPSTEQESKLIEIRRKKRNDIELDFYTTEAMTNRKWTEANNDFRSALNRLAIHGFHHKMCTMQNFHDPTDRCMCVLCGKHCERYHFGKCTKRRGSLLEYSINNERLCPP